MLMGTSQVETMAFYLRNDVPDNDLHTVIFAVQQQNLGFLEEMLYNVSDPLSSLYGKYLTNEEVAHLTGSPEKTKTLLSYLLSAGVNEIDTGLHGEYVTVTAPVHILENIFDTSFYRYSPVNSSVISNSSHHSIIRAESYSLDESIFDHITTVFNVIHFPLWKRSSSIPPLRVPDLTPLQKTSNNFINPAVLNSFYNIFTNQGRTDVKQTIYSTAGQYFSASDLALFQSLFGIPNHPIDNDPFLRNSNSRCKANANNCDESDLDIEYITAIAQNTYTEVIYDYYNDIMVTWITSVANNPTPSSVYSISYGIDELDLVGYSSYIDQFNIQAVKLGVQGVTVLVASGDDGAINGTNCAYNPSFPATSPYVTAVGATMGVESHGTEVVCQTNLGARITSGGGFSNFITRPSYQDTAVTAYFASGVTAPVSGYSATGRGIPDVSLAGRNYQTVIGGGSYVSDGTSCSTPAVAGMVSLINAARKNIGLPTVGFLNPTLYASGGSFANDITSGHNKCGMSACCPQGFYASTGWDPVTGFGSVNFTMLYNLLIPSASSSPTTSPTTMLPSTKPSDRPTLTPSTQPSAAPTRAPSIKPSQPTSRPTVLPSSPTAAPSSSPSTTPTAPSGQPSAAPSSSLPTSPSVTPTTAPTVAPSVSPSPMPTTTPTALPSAPTYSPTHLVSSAAASTSRRTSDMIIFWSVMFSFLSHCLLL